MSTDNRTQTVGLGCGTLILIGLIVFFLGNRGVGDLEKEVKALRAEVVKLREAPPTAAPSAVSPSPSLTAPSPGPNLDLDRLQSELREMREAIDAQNGQLKAMEEKLDRLAP